MKIRNCYLHGLGVTALGASLIGLAGAAWAGHHEDRFPVSIADAQARAQARFQEADRDANGVITREEFDAADWPQPGRGHGPKGHPKGPGMMHGPGGGPLPDPAERDRRLFRAMDENGDGMLSADEFSVSKMHAAGGELARAQIFDHLDGNDDGSLTRDELPDPARRLRSMDDDGDGMVTRAEAMKHHGSMSRSGGDAGAPPGADSDG